MSQYNKDIKNLVDYINDVKPYHSKLTQVNEELVFNDRAKVNISENTKITLRSLDLSETTIEF